MQLLGAEQVQASNGLVFGCAPSGISPTWPGAVEEHAAKPEAAGAASRTELSEQAIANSCHNRQQAWDRG